MNMARKGGREKGKKGLSAKYDLEKVTTNLPRGLYLWVKTKAKEKTISSILAEMLSELAYRRAVEYLRENGEKIGKDDLILVVIYGNEPFPAGFVAGRRDKAVYLPSSAVHTLERDLKREFGNCGRLFVLLTSPSASPSEWNRLGTELCSKPPKIVEWSEV